MKEIQYIGLYDTDAFKTEKRSYTLSAVNKMNYIIQALQKAGYRVRVVSPAWTGHAEGRFPKRTTPISDNAELVCCSTFGAKGKLRRLFRILHSMFWLFWYLMKNTKKEESVLVYHTVYFSLPVRLAKFFRRFRLILETEEVYDNATKLAFPLNVMEKKLLAAADSYLFSTELLAKSFDTNKPYACCNGIYAPAKRLAEPLQDGKIHLLYTGIIDFEKRGAFNAVEATRYLDENYVLHILGFGETEKLCARIQELNQTNRCQIIFDGLRQGDDFIRYCEQCHIGLSTQSMSGAYLQTSFPSKILSYLSMGLSVVSCYVECVSACKIGDLVSYYHKDDPQEIAKAIRQVSVQEGNAVILNRMAQLDDAFCEDMKRLIENENG